MNKKLVVVSLVFLLLLSSVSIAGFFDDGLVDSFTRVDAFSGYAVVGSAEPGVSTINLFSGFVSWFKRATTKKDVATTTKKATSAKAKPKPSNLTSSNESSGYLNKSILNKTISYSSVNKSNKTVSNLTRLPAKKYNLTTTQRTTMTLVYNRTKWNF